MTDYTLPLDALPDPLPIAPLTGPVDATIRPPGSKSLTNRAYVLAALADGESRIAHPLRSDDCDRLLAALGTLGAASRWAGSDLVMRGVRGRFPRGGTLDLGDGGAPTRFMIAAACLAEAPVVVDGSPRMRERPVAEGVELLRRLGADIVHLDTARRLPVRVSPSPAFAGGAVAVPTTMSSQFISALLLIGSALPGGLVLRYPAVITSEAYVTMTARVLDEWGVAVRPAGPAGAADGDGDRVHRVGEGIVRGRGYEVEADASSAAYWWLAASVGGGGRVTVPGLPRTSAQPDLGALAVLDGSRLRVQWRDDVATVQAADPTAPLPDIDATQMPDAALMLAVAAALAGRRRSRPCRITGLRTLRVKESDRIAALAAELGRIGCGVEATDDALRIDPSSRHEEPVVIETYRDHRMAMAFAILGLVRPGVSIRDPACVAKSYPGFWKDLDRLYL